MTYCLAMIWSIIKGTPWWVWPVFVYLLWIGIKALRPSIVPLFTIFILPIILLALSVKGLLWHVTPVSFAIWLTALLAGIGLGLFLLQKMRIKADKKNYLITLPGTKVTLIVVLIIFSVKYYFGYKFAVNPQLLDDQFFNGVRLVIMASITGLSVGRAISLLYKFYKAENTVLK